MKNELFTRIDNDINGNPRYVTHFLNLISDSDREKTKSDGIYQISNLYDLAIKKAKTIGGKKYRAKWYGGGIVFQSDLKDLENSINEMAKG